MVKKKISWNKFIIVFVIALALGIALGFFVFTGNSVSQGYFLDDKYYIAGNNEKLEVDGQNLIITREEKGILGNIIGPRSDSAGCYCPLTGDFSSSNCVVASSCSWTVKKGSNVATCSGSCTGQCPGGGRTSACQVSSSAA